MVHESVLIFIFFLFICRKITGRRLLRSSEVRLCSSRSTGAGSAQERALSVVRRLEALVACPEQSQSIGLCAQQLCEEGEAFALRQVRFPRSGSPVDAVDALPRRVAFICSLIE